LEKRGIRYEVLNYYHPVFMLLWRIELRLVTAHSVFRPLAFLLKKVKDGINRFYPLLSVRKLLQRSGNFDAVVLQRVLLEDKELASLRSQSPKIIFDFDDAVFLDEPYKTQQVASVSDLIIAGNNYNRSYALQFNKNCIVIPSTVPLDAFGSVSSIPIARENQDVRIGWIGSTATVHYLELLVNSLHRLKAQGYVFSLHIYGARLPQNLQKALKGIHLQCTPSYRGNELSQIVNEFDIGVMPLAQNEWEKGKCSMKALLYMAGAKPVISSRVGEIQTIISDGVNGLLAADEDEWFQHLKYLISDQGKRVSIGLYGRELVEKGFNTANWSEIWIQSILN
jgi:glycosyltransferase involved in cell wall biosynthesis